MNRIIPEDFFAPVCQLEEFFHYKFVLIIDGSTIASSHMWSFAIGSVPIMVSNANCWFSKFLIPFVHYVPVNYDLTNLKETILWLINNDHQAKLIAQNALLFANHYFSSDFQKKFIQQQIKK